MSLRAYSGYFTMPIGVGNQSITGVGFKPKVVIFFPGQTDGTGENQNQRFSVGASTGSGNNFAGIVLRDRDNVATTDSSRTWSSSHCIIGPESASDTFAYSATMVSMDADGFTINVDDGPGASKSIPFLALGGIDIDKVEVGSFALSTAAAGNTQDVTLAGAFQPDGLILLTSSSSSASESWGADAHACIGFTDGTRQFASANMSDDNQAAGTYARRATNDSILLRLDGAGAVDYEFGFNSFLSNGFRLDIDDAASGAFNVVYIAIKGPKFYAGDFTSRATAGDITSESALCGFTPKALFIGTNNNASYDVARGDNKLVVGATTGTEATRANTNVMNAISGEDNSDPTDSNTSLDLTHICGQVRTGGGFTGSQVLKSFDTNGFTLTQSDAGDDLNNNTYLAMGDNPSIQISISAVWKNVTEIQVVKSGAWKNVDDVNLAVSAAWKTV